MITKFKLYENQTSRLFKNEEQLKDLLLKDKDFAKGDVHQALLNIFYAVWHKENPAWSYDDFIKYVNDTYGELALFAVYFAKYCYQVDNGGHAQYIGNGFASSKSSGFGGKYKNIDKHKHFIKLFIDLGMNELPNGQKAFDIISKLTLNSRTWNNLDDKWYDDVNENILEDFNNYLKTLTIAGEKISDLFEIAEFRPNYIATKYNM